MARRNDRLIPVRLFGCGKFRRLMSEELDSPLGERERRFMELHRSVCPPCREVEAQSSLALNMLRGMAMEHEVSRAFDERVIRRLRVQTVKESLNYWSPAVLGAAIACLAVLAAMQMMSKPSSLPPLHMGATEARHMTSGPVYPELQLPRSPNGR